MAHQNKQAVVGALARISESIDKVAVYRVLSGPSWYERAARFPAGPISP